MTLGFFVGSRGLGGYSASGNIRNQLRKLARVARAFDRFRAISLVDYSS